MSTKSPNTALERIPHIQLDTLKGWETLISQDQQTIQKETRLLAESILDAGKSRLKIGEHLAKIRDILEPKRMFTKFLQASPFRSRATAYRYIDTYMGARTILPSPVMQVALMRGTDTINARLVKAFPPPKSNDITVINTYLDKIAKKERGKKEPDERLLAETMKKECFNFIRTRWERLPETMTKREKTVWMNDLRGMTMTLQGVSNTLTIEASAIPSHYVRPRGRPRLKELAS